MRNVSTKVIKKIRTHFVINFFFPPEKSAVYKIIWKRCVEPGSPAPRSSPLAPNPSQGRSQSTLYNHQSPIHSLSCSFLSVAACQKSRIFMTWKTPQTFGIPKRFCETPGQNTLKPMRPGPVGFLSLRSVRKPVRLLSVRLASG